MLEVILLRDCAQIFQHALFVVRLLKILLFYQPLTRP